MSVLTSSEIDKWVTAVTDLMQLTVQGKIVWKPISKSELGSVYLMDRYEAEFDGRTLRLDVDNMRTTALTSGIARLLVRNEPLIDVRLAVIKDGEETIVFPPVVALRGLAAIVRDNLYADDGTEDFLSDLHKAVGKK